jgi:hypothetical protein
MGALLRHLDEKPPAPDVCEAQARKLYAAAETFQGKEYCYFRVKLGTNWFFFTSLGDVGRLPLIVDRPEDVEIPAHAPGMDRSTGYVQPWKGP